MTDSPHRSPFADLREALGRENKHADESIEANQPTIRVDANRARRSGIPEVVFASGKTSAEVADGLRRLVEANGRALASRVRAEDVRVVQEALEPEISVESHPVARSLVAFQPGTERPQRGGVVGILSAGTSDIPVAAEASLAAAEMGATVLEAWDVGVAGLHRLVLPLERFITARAHVIVVAAGMDGALPSVVAGLVDIPVIGLPTSVGYGLGAGGVGALTTMLQSCAPGLVVVNIDSATTSAVSAWRGLRARRATRAISAASSGDRPGPDSRRRSSTARNPDSTSARAPRSRRTLRSPLLVSQALWSSIAASSSDIPDSAVAIVGRMGTVRS
jgi:pyridinium-3,5-biscarboxylic acid mononucleotide synthase